MFNSFDIAIHLYYSKNKKQFQNIEICTVKCFPLLPLIPISLPSYSVTSQNHCLLCILPEFFKHVWSKYEYILFLCVFGQKLAFCVHCSAHSLFFWLFTSGDIFYISMWFFSLSLSPLLLVSLPVSHCLDDYNLPKLQ